jgi:hypothetical protein
MNPPSPFANPKNSQQLGRNVLYSCLVCLLFDPIAKGSFNNQHQVKNINFNQLDDLFIRPTTRPVVARAGHPQPADHRNSDKSLKLFFFFLFFFE